MSVAGTGLYVYAVQMLPFSFPLRASNSFSYDYNRTDGSVIFYAGPGNAATLRVAITSLPPSANPIGDINVNVSSQTSTP
jgi:hypothetical protein